MTSSVFQLIDLDRTLFDTSAFAKAITEEVNLLYPGIGTQLDKKFEEAYAREETFFLLRYLRAQKGDAWFEKLAARVLEKGGPERFVLPGARERLAFAETLSNEKPAWGILTYGDEIDQRLKLSVMNLDDAPMYITSTPDKAPVIASWKRPDGTFQLPAAFGGRVVERLSFEDDKLRAFRGLPAGVRGIWLTSNAHAEVLINEGDFANTEPVHTLQQSIQLLKKYF